MFKSEGLYVSISNVIKFIGKKGVTNECDITNNNIITEIKKLISHKNKYNNIILKRLWEFFYSNYIDVLADIDYGYCITVHKSQGSTYKKVYVNIMDIIKNNTTDTKSCVYTAVTRASDSLIVLKT